MSTRSDPPGEARDPGPALALRAARAAVLDDGRCRGPDLRARLTAAADDWLVERLGAEPDVALVAVGGYGRGEPAPGSDLDLVLVHSGRSDVAALAERIWYPIWDAGVGLDHAVRTVSEAVAVAREDLKAALGLLDARFVAGERALAGALREQAFAVWRRDARRRLPELREAVEERWARAGELAFLLEPDLKECRGGLRDVQALRAVAAAWVADVPLARLYDACALILDVRGELHRRPGRRSDRLVLQEQDPVASAAGWEQPEEMMRAVSAAARTVAYVADLTWRRVAAATRPARRWSRTAVRRPLAPDVVAQDGEVVLARDADPERDPTLLLRVAAAAAQHDLPLAPHALHRLAAGPPLPEPWPAGARDAFLALLGAGGPAVDVIEALDQEGLFARLLPEWDQVRCRPQRNAVHRFTVDRHLVATAVEAAARARDVHRPDLLLLGGLLHDIGKGWPGDHTDAGVRVVPAIAQRMGLPANDVDVLVTLVRYHLLLPDTATRRDLDDPATVHAVADAVGDRDTLELLHALTEADALATGPAAWGEWKARLVADLVRRTAAELGGASAQTAPVAPRLEHLPAGVEVEVAGDAVTVRAPDRPGLLWRWAAVLAVHRLTIRAATAGSVDGVAVTSFDVVPQFGSPPDWAAVEADLRHAYDDAGPLTRRLAERERAYLRDTVMAPPRVLWFDDASDRATVVEVRAHDTVGLLHRLTRALAEAGLDVRAARISTLGAEAVDAFYVTADGRPLHDSPRRAEVEQALLSAAQPAG